MVNPYKDRMLIEYNIKKGGVNFGDVPPRPKHLHLIQLGERSYI